MGFPSKLKDFRHYIDGQGYAGVIPEVGLPKLALKTEDWRAGGMLGPASMASTARPDGYTLSQLPMGAFRIPHMQKVEWDPIRDFTYIIGVTQHGQAVLLSTEVGLGIDAGGPSGSIWIQVANETEPNLFGRRISIQHANIDAAKMAVDFEVWMNRRAGEGRARRRRRADPGAPTRGPPPPRRAIRRTPRGRTDGRAPLGARRNRPGRRRP